MARERRSKALENNWADSGLTDASPEPNRENTKLMPTFPNQNRTLSDREPGWDGFALSDAQEE